MNIPLSPLLTVLQQAYGNDAIWLPPGSGYIYLVGYTAQRRRAICLKDDRGSCVVTREDVLAAYREVQYAGLVTPFLFFGRSKLYGDDAFIFMQYAWDGNVASLPRRLYRS